MSGHSSRQSHQFQRGVKRALAPVQVSSSPQSQPSHQLPPTRGPRQPGLRFDQILASVLLAGALLLEGAVVAPSPDLPHQLVPQISMAAVPVVQGEVVSSASISAQSFLVLDRDSASVLAQRADRTPQYPASTLKLLTAIVVLQHWLPTQTLTLTASDVVAKPDIQDPLAWQAGETVSIHDLLASLLINSDNLTATILAAHYPGGAPAFVEEMERTAAQLSLTQTHFTNPVGLDEPDQKLSAWDLAILAKAALDYPVLADLVQQKTYTVVDRRQGVAMKHFLTNTNQLLWSSWQVKGIKTGTTDLAGEVLVSLVTLQGHDVIVVVMGSQDRYADTQRLLTEVQNNYQWKSWGELSGLN